MLTRSEQTRWVVNDHTRWVGKQIQIWLSKERMSREQLAIKMKCGKGLVDKLCSGRYSEKTLARAMEVTKLTFKIEQSVDNLGGYERDKWRRYEGMYLMIEYSYPFDGSITVRRVEIYWNKTHPGFFIDVDAAGGENVGAVSIPHERSPLIYIRILDQLGKPREGRYIALSTMVGEQAMRGLKLSVQQVVANAYVPTATPIAFVYLSSELDKIFYKSCALTAADDRFDRAKSELKKTIDNRYAIFSGL